MLLYLRGGNLILIDNRISVGPPPSLNHTSVIYVCLQGFRPLSCLARCICWRILLTLVLNIWAGKGYGRWGTVLRRDTTLFFEKRCSCGNNIIMSRGCFIWCAFELCWLPTRSFISRTGKASVTNLLWLNIQSYVHQSPSSWLCWDIVCPHWTAAVSAPQGRITSETLHQLQVSTVVALALTFFHFNWISTGPSLF